MFIWVPDFNVKNNIRYGTVIKQLLDEFIEPIKSKKPFDAVAIYCNKKGEIRVVFDEDIIASIEFQKPTSPLKVGERITVEMKNIKNINVETGEKDESPVFALFKFGDYWGFFSNCGEDCCLYRILRDHKKTSLTKKAGQEVKSETQYYILIKWHDVFYKLGKIKIKTHNGDVYYFLSGDNYVDKYEPSRKIDHISWHPDGRTHIKFRESEDLYDIIDNSEQRLGFRDVGFQEMMVDTVQDFTKLSRFDRIPSDLDVIFEVGDYFGSVAFHFTIISGNLILAIHDHKEIGVHTVDATKDEFFIDTTKRALGHHSGHGDILLQYSLKVAKFEERQTNRNIFLRKNMDIRKIL